MACLTLHSRLLAAANMSVVCETLTNLGKEFRRFSMEVLIEFLVEHLIQWFSSSSVTELEPSAISLDIQNPIVEMKLKQVNSILRLFFSNLLSDLDSFDIGISSRNN